MRIVTYPHELIGVHIRILDSTSKGLVGLEGKIIDETRTLLHVRLHNGKEVKLLKSALIILLIWQKG